MWSAFEAAKFINIVERVYEWSMRELPEAEKAKDIGKITKINLMKGLDGLRLLLLNHDLGWTREQVESLEEKFAKTSTIGRSIFTTLRKKINGLIICYTLEYVLLSFV